MDIYMFNNCLIWAFLDFISIIDMNNIAYLFRIETFFYTIILLSTLHVDIYLFTVHIKHI